MRTSLPANVESEREEGIVEITRTRLATPRLVSPAEAKLLFQKRVVQIDCPAAVRTADPG